MRPEVLILDEPMAGLDVAMQIDLVQILDRLHADGMTIVIATHDMDFAYQWADSISAMAKGECIASWETRIIPDKLQKLAAYGLGVPKVAEIHQGLISCGILDKDVPSPRSHQDLLKTFASFPAYKLSHDEIVP